MNLSGKTAIVTGGGRDIGRACAIRLAQAGANVAINYHASASGADSAVAEIGSERAFAMQGDMTAEAEVKAFIEKAASTFGGIDIVVHVTGGLVERVPMRDMSLAHFHTVMDLNLTSNFLVVREAVAHMSNGGAIVNLASQAGRDGGGPGAGIYAASKGAVMTMTRAMAKEFGPDIRVNALCPGMIDTDFHNNFTKDEVRINVANATPLKREGTSEDCANLVAYLASDEAAFVTGACVDINGGLAFS
ncbi:MAG: glucose 1-dehydrogenase [Gammaproteobacteria bacterium]|nr:glucose 1-dehydrogenase [Gammaproteobacteria bacterium]